jgi:acetyl-CoA carboxylase beta subunit
MEHKKLNTEEPANSVSGTVSSSASQSWRKCKHCGKFLSYKQLEEQKDVMHVFIPDTAFTIEESYFVHKHCW